MKKFYLLLLVILVCTVVIYGQTTNNKEEAFKIGKQSIKFMDKGQYNESIALLEKAAELDPQNYMYPYEIAYANYLNKQNNKAITILEKVISSYDTVDAQCYQLLGNIYDYEKKPEKAIEIYQNGLKKFPDSGQLYLELGIVEAFVNKNMEKALNYWETGIQRNPQYPSNYYWATKMYCNSEEEIWGVIYGELFMNIERNSKRTQEISQLLYNTYRKAITIKSKKEMAVSFSKSSNIFLPQSGKEFKLPFPMQYELIMTLSTVSLLNGKEKIKELNAHSINLIRSNFIKQWYLQSKDKDFPNPLFDWQKQIDEKGYAEAYNYWLMMKGNENEFDQWYTKNKSVFDEFANWFTDNSIFLSKEHKFYSKQY